MWPDRVSNPGTLTYESGALPTALRCPANGPRRSKFFLSEVYPILEKFNHLGTQMRCDNNCLPLKSWGKSM